MSRHRLRRVVRYGREVLDLTRVRFFGGGALALLYHRIVDERTDPFKLCVSPARFSEHLEVLTKIALPVALPTLASDLTSGSIRPGAVAVTFDDGYADNISMALPLLERYEVPATVFVVTGGLGKPFWWDRLRFHLSESTSRAEGDAPAVRSRGRSEGELYPRLQALPAIERERVLTELGVSDTFDSYRGPRALTAPEVQRLGNSGLIDVGAHTESHPILAKLNPSQQAHEIQASRDRLRSLIERDVVSFSYPYGLNFHFDEHSLRLVRQFGFTCACTAERGFVRSATDRYRIPRLWVENWTGDEFEMRVRQWLGQHQVSAH